MKGPLVFALVLAGAALGLYRLAFYGPPLLDPGRRNILDAAIDFFSCGWHLTLGTFSNNYLKDQNRAAREYFEAGWHREKVLLKAFGVRRDELAVFLAAAKKESRRAVKTRLSLYVVSSASTKADFLEGAGREFLKAGNSGAADRALALARELRGGGK